MPMCPPRPPPSAWNLWLPADADRLPRAVLARPSPADGGDAAPPGPELRPAGADEEILDCQVVAQHGEPYRDLQGLDKRPPRLGVGPVMRRREVLLDREEAGQAGPEVAERLDIAVRPVDTLGTVIEVHVRRDETPVLFEQIIDFCELLLLELPHVLENALRDDDVELLAVEADRRFKDVRLKQVRCVLLYRDVDPEVVDVLAEQALQRRRSAADIQQVTRPGTSDLVDDARALAHPVVRSGELEVFFTPEITLIILRATIGTLARHTHWITSSVTSAKRSRSTLP